jgi:hypothetical protein
MHLTREDGDAIRCALLEHFAKPEAQYEVHMPFAMQKETWSVSPPSQSGAGPRIGEYWVKVDADGGVVLERTLWTDSLLRFQLTARLVRASHRWAVERFGSTMTRMLSPSPRG